MKNKRVQKPLIFNVLITSTENSMNFVDALSWDPVNIKLVSKNFGTSAYDYSGAEPFSTRPSVRINPTARFIEYEANKRGEFVPIFISGTGGQYDSGWKNCEIFKTEYHGQVNYYVTLSAVWTGYPRTLGKVSFVDTY